MDELVRVRFTEDKKAAFIGDKQYISFERLAEIRRDQAKEMKLLNDQVSKLLSKNAAYKALLKEKGAYVVEIDPLYFKADILSKKLLDSEIRMVGSMMSDGKLHVVL